MMSVAVTAQATSFDGKGKAPATCTLNGSTYTCATIFADANDVADIAGGITVLVTSDLTFGYFQDLRMAATARLETTGSYDIAITNTQQNNFSTNGATIKAGGDFSLGNGKTMAANIIGTNVSLVGSSSKLTGTITASGAVDIVSGSEVTGAVSAGSAVVRSNAKLGSTLTVNNGGVITLESSVTIAGAVSGGSITTSSNVTLNGPVNVSGQALFESQSIVYGTVNAGSLVLKSANATINGNVKVTGDVTLENSTVINGDLDASNVKTGDSYAKINGNAAVNSIYFGYGGTVSKVITCKAPPPNAPKCSCVTTASTYSYSPTCAAGSPPPPASVHHFQITHSGNALTCQPQTVTVTACANAACTAPHYTGSVKTTLQPGGAEFTVVNGSNNAATVSRSTAGTATLSASGAANASTCVNAAAGGTSCDMVFSDRGLTLSVPDHVSMTTASVTVQALKSASAPNAGKSCVPLLANTTATVNFSCSQLNPANGAKPPVALKNQDAAGYTSVSCGSGSTGVPLNFDANGLASANLQYPEAGNVGLSASYTSGTLGASTPAATAFTVAPFAFRLKATRSATTPVLPAGVFARASEQFTLQIAAVNALPDDPNNPDANVTKNFGKENTPESVKPGITVTAPAGGGGTLTGSFVLVNGVASGTYSFDETATLAITAVSANASGYYLGIQASGFNTRGTLNPGRFIPDHFDTTLPAPPTDTNEGDTMDCTNTGGLVQPCNKRLVYSGQPFQLIVTAYNGAGAVTKNYTGSYAKTITLGSWSDSNDTATTKAVAIPGMGWTGAAGATRYTFTDGVGKLVPDAQGKSNLPYFAFAAASTPSNPTRFVVRASDGDGVSSQRSVPVEQELTAISGQLYIAPGFGSATAPMPVNLEARFYVNGAYRINPAFNGPTPAVVSGALLLSNCQKALAADPKTGACNSAGQLKLSGKAQQNFKNGKASFFVQGPQVGPGAVGMSLRAPCATGTTCAVTDWIGYLPRTVGNLTFGIYRAGPVIYTREVY